MENVIKTKVILQALIPQIHACLVAQGFNNLAKITIPFSPVPKTSVRLLPALTAGRSSTLC